MQACVTETLLGSGCPDPTGPPVSERSGLATDQMCWMAAEYWQVGDMAGIPVPSHSVERQSSL